MLSEELLELFYDQSSEGVLITDDRGEILGCNPACLHMFGYEEQELVGELVEVLVPSARRMNHVQHRTGYAEEPKKRPMGIGMDLEGQRKDGSVFPVELSLSYIQRPERMRIMATINDITERKNQEKELLDLNNNLENKVEERTKELERSQRLHSLVSRNFPKGTINVIDQNYNYIFSEGQELYKMGMTNEQFVGKNYFSHLPETVRLLIQDKLQLVFGGTDQSFEINVDERYYRINAVGLSNDEGIVERVLLVETNISEQKAAVLKTEQALEKQREINEMKSRFVSMASHEFRTPLSTIVSSLNLLKKHDEAGNQEKKDRHISKIKKSAYQLNTILNDFLSVEKIDEGKTEVQSQEFNLAELAREIGEDIQESSQHNLSYNFSFEGEEMIKSDQQLLRIIITNLTSNAFKYTPEDGEVSLTISNQNTLEIVVKDSGIGIDKGEQEQLFQRFFRAKNALNIDGTGLGLHIVKKYAELLGGTLILDSELNRGTTVTIKI